MGDNMKVKLENLGTVNKNVVTLNTEKGSVLLYFSYSTIVAVDNIVSKNNWSKTTGKLLNELEPNKNLRVPHEAVLKEVEKRINAILCKEDF
jgi:hypothetical protein